jgi:hypothetical protein
MHRIVMEFQALSGGEFHLPKISLWGKSALRHAHLNNIRINTSKSHSLSSRQRIHGLQRHIYAGGRPVDAEYVYAFALICYLKASAALWIIPPADEATAADARESRDCTLSLVTIF